eukprot:TRINITY_DN9117_c0_g2_i3.p2 TRINITY_DN9117_c0_g2~~TRINITY_DN9117_c0_g2_i3.p2  ORF type:complete len:198 (-),score=-5.48 TRINITY_DN9117_c0_g2_i3:251-820(-)
MFGNIINLKQYNILQYDIIKIQFILYYQFQQFYLQKNFQDGMKWMKIFQIFVGLKYQNYQIQYCVDNNQQNKYIYIKKINFQKRINIKYKYILQNLVAYLFIKYMHLCQFQEGDFVHIKSIIIFYLKIIFTFLNQFILHPLNGTRCLSQIPNNFFLGSIIIILKQNDCFGNNIIQIYKYKIQRKLKQFL